MKNCYFKKDTAVFNPDQVFITCNLNFLEYSMFVFVIIQLYIWVEAINFFEEFPMIFAKLLFSCIPAIKMDVRLTILTNICYFYFRLTVRR